MGEIGPTSVDARPGANRPLRARVLVVDDDPLLRKVIVRVLEKYGYNVAAATDGVEAVVAHANGAFDVILMDCQMPKLDGFEATKAIRRAEAQSGAHTPIIALTAMQGARGKCLEAGMDDYVTKPIQPPEIDALIRRTILEPR